MGKNLLRSWSSGSHLDAEELIESDLSIAEIRSKIDGIDKGTKIDLAYRLALYTTNRTPSNDNSNSKIDTIITRTVKLVRLYEQAKQNRGYTEAEG